MNRYTFRSMPIFVALLLTGCSALNPDPLESLQRELSSYPEYTVTLNDYTQEGNFFPSYYHQYKVVVGEEQAGSDALAYRDEVQDFTQVSEGFYNRYEPYLGMAVLSKAPDDEVTTTPFPPGYQYVGDPQYGSWQQDGNGGQFWQFAGQYLLLSTIFNSLNGPPIYRDDWGGYTTARRSNRPYFGPGNRYGTTGTLTRQTNPTFFERQQTRQAASRQSFGNRVQNRVGRSNGSSTRGRSSFSSGGK